MEELLKKRRSIRKYTDQMVEEETVDKLISAVLRSPSGKGIDPWEILYVNDASIVYNLASAKAHGAVFLKKTQQCLVILADPTKTDVWIEDTSIAMTIGHLTATDLGLGSCWIQIRQRETMDGTPAEAFVKAILNIPTSMRVEGILAFGYANEEKIGHGEERLDWNKVSKNVYGESYKRKLSE